MKPPSVLLRRNQLFSVTNEEEEEGRTSELDVQHGWKERFAQLFPNFESKLLNTIISDLNKNFKNRNIFKKHDDIKNFLN